MKIVGNNAFAFKPVYPEKFLKIKHSKESQLDVSIQS